MTEKVFNKVRIHLKDKDVRIDKLAIHKNKRGIVSISILGCPIPINFIEDTDKIENITIFKDFIIILYKIDDICIYKKIHRKDIKFVRMMKGNLPLHSRTTVFK